MKEDRLPTSARELLYAFSEENVHSSAFIFQGFSVVNELYPTKDSTKLIFVPIKSHLTIKTTVNHLPTNIDYDRLEP